MTEINTDAIIQRHNTRGEYGRYAEEGAVANMVEDAYLILSNVDGKVDQKTMNGVTEKLKKGLEDFGVTGLSVFDLNHNNKIDTGDIINVKVTKVVNVAGVQKSGEFEYSFGLGRKHKENPSIGSPSFEVKTQKSDGLDAWRPKQMPKATESVPDLSAFCPETHPKIDDASFNMEQVTRLLTLLKRQEKTIKQAPLISIGGIDLTPWAFRQ